MCGRYYVKSSLNDDIIRVVKKIDPSCDVNALPKSSVVNHDVHPADEALIITSANPVCQIMRWGFSYSENANLIINARAESVEEKRMFRESVRHHRCVIPASGFYEWNSEKEKVVFFRESNTLVYMMGFYDMIRNEPRFVILTTGANDSMKPVHDRMPCIIEENQIYDWLMDDGKTSFFLNAGSPMLQRKQEYEQQRLFA